MAEIIEIVGPGAASEFAIDENFDQLVRVRWPCPSLTRRDVVVSIDLGEDAILELTPDYGTFKTTPALIRMPKASDSVGQTFAWTAAPVDQKGTMPVVQIRIKTVSAPSATTKVSVSAS
jgi:hypothetical protein